MTTKMTNNVNKSLTIAILSIAFAVSGISIGSAEAVKTHATYWFDPNEYYHGVSAKYTVEEQSGLDGWLASPTWLRTSLLADLLEIGWIDGSGSVGVQYYCGYQGDIYGFPWGSPNDGDSTTYYIYDIADDGDFDLIGGFSSCEIDTGSYTIVKIETGYEDSKDANSLPVKMHQNLKYYDGDETWNA